MIGLRIGGGADLIWQFQQISMVSALQNGCTHRRDNGIVMIPVG